MDETARNFIEAFVQEDISEGGRFYGKQVHTRFPPEPNGYLHIGHCKALTIDFSTAEKFGGICNLRMDDTNPAKEDSEYVDAIQDDIHWLGFDWGDRFFYGSDYFEKTYEYAIELINKGLAYVCELSPEQFREYRGDTSTPARSPWRDRPIEESLDLFRRMRNGEFEEGKYTLRAKIDLASGNFNMRDPVLYRIRYIEHHRQGTKWCIFPMYDFAHPIQDALEGITHSLCSLEYEAHRPLYDWVVNNVSVPSKPRQIEFARLGINYTVMSKRKLRQLVEEGRVSGWDDPRMPTLCGLRRRGYTARSIRSFCEKIGVSKVDSTVDWALLESCLRDDLNANARRVMAVLNPVKLVVTNYPEGQSELLTVENNPLKPEDGNREISFSRELWIEAEDFMEVPAPKYKRLHPGYEVRLKGAYLVTCTGCKKDDDGNILEIYCEYDPMSRGGDPADGRKVKGATIHWVDANNCAEAEVRLYDYLFNDAEPDGADKNFLDCINPQSLVTLKGCKKDDDGNILEIYCEYDPMSRGGDPADGRKVKGATIHWVDANNCAEAEVRLYDYLFNDAEPDGADKNFLDCINPQSLVTLKGCKVEAALKDAPLPEKAKDSLGYQFMRQGYFCLDNKDASRDNLVFNRAVALKDSFKK